MKFNMPEPLKDKKGHLRPEDIAKMIDAKVAAYNEKFNKVHQNVEQYRQNVDDSNAVILKSIAEAVSDLKSEHKESFKHFKENVVDDGHSKLNSKIEEGLKNLTDLMLSNIHTLKQDQEKFQNNVLDLLKQNKSELREIQDQLHADMGQGDLELKEKSQLEHSHTRQLLHEVFGQTRDEIKDVGSVCQVKIDEFKKDLENKQKQLNSIREYQLQQDEKLGHLTQPQDNAEKDESIKNNFKVLAQAYDSSVKRQDEFEKSIKGLILSIKEDLHKDIENKLNAHTVEILKLFNGK